MSSLAPSDVYTPSFVIFTFLQAIASRECGPSEIFPYFHVRESRDSQFSSSSRPSRQLQPIHALCQSRRVDTKLKVQQKAQRDFQIQQLCGTHPSHLCHALLAPFIVFQRFCCDPCRGERESVYCSVRRWQHSFQYAQTVDVMGCGQVDARTVRTVGVLSCEVGRD